jgi:hypothetical protein
MNSKCVIALLLLVSFILPSSAIVNLTYSDEYYRLGSLSTQIYSNFDFSYVNGWNMNFASTATAGSTALSAVELRRQSILMEKQNELLAEQNELMRMQMNQTMECTVTSWSYNGNGKIYTCKSV